MSKFAYVYNAAHRAAGSLAHVGAIGTVIVGVGCASFLFAGERTPVSGAAYTAFSEVEDSPIEDIADLQPGVIHRSRDGLFYANLTVNDVRLRCIVDTGASATVLNAADGRRVGLDSLRFNGRLHTAGGAHPAARGRLEEVALAGHSFRRVPAYVVRNAPTPCLLGQDILARLDSAEIRGNKLILR